MQLLQDPFVLTITAPRKAGKTNMVVHMLLQWIKEKRYDHIIVLQKRYGSSLIYDQFLTCDSIEFYYYDEYDIDNLFKTYSRKKLFSRGTLLILDDYNENERPFHEEIPYLRLSVIIVSRERIKFI